MKAVGGRLRLPAALVPLRHRPFAVLAGLARLRPPSLLALDRRPSEAPSTSMER